MSSTTTRNSNPLSRLPPSLSRWLGYRSTTPPPPPNPVIWTSSFVGSFAGLAIAQAIFTTPYFEEKGVPPLIASYGASAVLIYGVLDGPLAQPRALFGGHLLASLTGVSLSKLFSLLPQARFHSLKWLASSLSTSLTIVLMQVTGTSHPPAGATALIPILDDRVRALGWDYVWVVVLTSGVMCGVALLVANVGRRWPVWWVVPPVSVAGTVVFSSRNLGKGGPLEGDKKVEEVTSAMMGAGQAVVPPRDPMVLPSTRQLEGDHGNQKERSGSAAMEQV